MFDRLCIANKCNLQDPRHADLAVRSCCFVRVIRLFYILISRQIYNLAFLSSPTSTVFSVPFVSNQIEIHWGCGLCNPRPALTKNNTHQRDQLISRLYPHLCCYLQSELTASIHTAEKKKKMLETIKYLIGSAGPSGYGSKTTADEVTGDSSLDLRSSTAIITGATSGIGAETARVLAKRGARLVLPVRNLKAAEETKARIVSEVPDSEIIVMALDLSSLTSVRNFASDFEALNLPLNLLINNAGKFSHDHGISEDGVEMTFATNYLGHFLLTKLLLEKMIQTAKTTGVQGRVVNVSSGIHSWFSGDSIRALGELTRDKSHYDATRAYAISKLANVLHTKELARRLKQMEANLTVNCVHPGVVRTGLTRDREGFVTDLVFFLASKLVKTIPQAAATTCYVATHPMLTNVSGKYFADCNEASNSKLGCNLQEAERLWSFSEIMVSTDPKAVFSPSNALD